MAIVFDNITCLTLDKYNQKVISRSLMRFKEKVKLIFWLWSSAYEQTLQKVLTPAFKADILGVMQEAQKVFPFVNQAYFQNYQTLKNATIQKWGVQVQEVALPSDLLGVYCPGTSKENSVIFINQLKSALFRLATLAHETSHIPVSLYFHQHWQTRPNYTLVRHRIAAFSTALQDREEICADILTAMGAYPQKDFVEIFGRNSFGWFALLKAFVHLPRHYPELLLGVLRGRDLILNLAFTIHFLKLRYFLYSNYRL